MEEIFSTIIKISNFCLCNENRTCSSCQISLAELRGLKAMEATQSITCSALSEKMVLSPSRSSRIIDSLVKKGYLKRDTDDHDRRLTFLCLTKKGQKIKYDIEKENKKFEQLLTSELSQQEIEAIKSGLSLLEKLLTKNIKGDKHVRKNISRTQ